MLSGEKTDDPVYVPLIDRVHQGLGRAGLLYVGDCKMAAEKTRAHIQAQGDFSLCPLSALHVPPATLAQNVEAYLAAGSPLIQVVREAETDQPKCIAQGYETLVERLDRTYLKVLRLANFVLINLMRHAVRS